MRKLLNYLEHSYIHGHNSLVSGIFEIPLNKFNEEVSSADDSHEDKNYEVLFKLNVNFEYWNISLLLQDSLINIDFEVINNCVNIVKRDKVLKTLLEFNLFDEINLHAIMIDYHCVTL